MTDPTDAEMEAKKETARAKAEARRQRILAKQGERMGVVSGGTEGQTGADGSGDVASGAGAAAEGMASPSGGMSKYAAARRRRYGNKKAAAAPAPAEESSIPAETKSEAPAPAPAAATAEATETKTENEEPASADAAASDTEATKDNKKYMGVAKMRRKMIAEKKKKEEAEASTASSASGRKLGVPRSMSNVAKESVKQHRAAVLMQLFTLVLLFLAGLGVGMQNHALNDGVVVVNDELSHSENGIGALRILGLGKASKTASEDARDRLLEKEEEVKVPVGANGAGAEAEGDEFGEDATAAAATDGAESKPKGVGGDDKVPNIDPLFRVDLDELTAGPGIFNIAARLAVKVHRSIMYIFLVMPLSIIKSIFALPSALMTNPPILFLMSVVIRYVGRDLLGARLPDLNTVQGGATEVKGSDLIGSAKNMATNFLSSSFPAAAKLLEVFSDAKQDMFVILCGFFIGMVLPIHLGKEAGKDEL